MRTHTFTIPVRLPRLNAFNRQHWAQKKRDVDKWRGLVMMFGGKEVFSGQVEITITQIVAPKEVRMDRTNLIGIADKMVIDALVKLGVIKNDSPRYVTDIHTGYERGKESGVRITISSTPTGTTVTTQG